LQLCRPACRSGFHRAVPAYKFRARLQLKRIPNVGRRRHRLNAIFGLASRDFGPYNAAGLVRGRRVSAERDSQTGREWSVTGREHHGSHVHSTIPAGRAARQVPGRPAIAGALRGTLGGFQAHEVRIPPRLAGPRRRPARVVYRRVGAERDTVGSGTDSPTQSVPSISHIDLGSVATRAGFLVPYGVYGQPVNGNPHLLRRAIHPRERAASRAPSACRMPASESVRPAAPPRPPHLASRTSWRGVCIPDLNRKMKDGAANVYGKQNLR